MSLIPNGQSGEEGGYTIERSLRWRESTQSIAYRTPSTATNRTTWTWSGWVKITKLGEDIHLWNVQQNKNIGTDNFYFRITSDGGLGAWQERIQQATYWRVRSTEINLRDPSAWYHIVLSVNTSSGTANQRIRMYVNNQEVPYSGANINPSQGFSTLVNSTIEHRIGTDGTDGSNWNYGEMYATEINFVDGQQLTPSSFGEYNTDTGAWSPIEYTGSYGTNGFYLNFSNNSSATTLGYDQSSNSNNFTMYNFSLTSGSTYDSMQDVPTLTSASAANYNTLNPLIRPYSGAEELRNGNLTLYCGSASVSGSAWGTMLLNSGKWYYEAYITAKGSGDPHIGYSSRTDFAGRGTWTQDARYYGYFYQANGNKWTNSSTSAYGATFTTGDTIGVALDLDSSTITFYKNNSSQGTISSITSPSGAGWTPACEGFNGTTIDNNYGQRPFTYTPPTGYKALNTYNLTDPTIKDSGEYYNTVLYTGNGSAGHSITGVGFQPDLVWIKGRSYAEWHALHTSLLGTGKFFKTAEADSEVTNRPNSLTSYNSDGFTVGSEAVTNSNGQTYVSWNWKLGGSSGSTNTSGSITSSVSASTTSGMSVVTYTGTGSTGTVGHGLGATPSMVICQVRNQASDWPVYHIGCGATAYLNLNETRACTTNSSPWNNTAPTSSVFTVGSSYGTNWPSGNCVAWCFAPVEGFSAFGSYVGNGNSDGTFVWLGFKVRWLLVKNSNAAEHWRLFDSTMWSSGNVQKGQLLPSSNSAEYNGDAYFDFTSNGFKVRAGDTPVNGNGHTLIYAAFAENPFKYALAR